MRRIFGFRGLSHSRLSPHFPPAVQQLLMPDLGSTNGYALVHLESLASPLYCLLCQYTLPVTSVYLLYHALSEYQPISVPLSAVLGIQLRGLSASSQHLIRATTQTRACSFSQRHTEKVLQDTAVAVGQAGLR